MSKYKNQITSGGKQIAMLVMMIACIFFSNSASADSGAELFKNNCSVCHQLTDENTIGPGLAGINEKRSEEWLFKWIKNSSEMIAAGDEEAIAIYNEFNKSAMPGFERLGDDGIQSIIAYMANPVEEGGTNEGAVTSSETESGGDSSGVSEGVSSFLFWGILIIIFAIVYFYRYTRKVKKLSREDGIFFGPHRIKNFPLMFFIVLAIISLVILMLVEGLNTNIGHINGVLFASLPYVAFAIFIVGSIYRYTKRGYKVSSLSSQFLEGKKLFWGSQPFHWGLLVLFLGHLIAFLFPRAVIAWNGQPIRLLILEISSFAFALLALLGLILLIKRRLSTKTLLVVTNKMDMIVYGILLTQIISGIGVAFFVRWGSSWFASVLTPYLRSIFSFSPDIAAVSEAPVWIQIHIISAFVIIAIIPFTRFMHFLVAPIDYIWRKYQLVIWNWNRTRIRQSTRHTFGKKPRNH